MIATHSWVKTRCVINAEMRCYRDFVLQGLQTDGYTIIDATDAEPQENQQVINEVRAVSEDLYTAECSAIANCETLCDRELKKLQDKRVPVPSRYWVESGGLAIARTIFYVIAQVKIEFGGSNHSIFGQVCFFVPPAFFIRFAIL